jgi:iron(III) transport system substrate-binding protein
MKCKSPVLFYMLIASLLLNACVPAVLVNNPNPNEVAKPQKLVVYSGRSESLVGPIIEQFKSATGIEVEVRWGSTPELAATLLEEGQNSPADLFFAQDPGGLGAVIDLLAPLPEEVTGRVDANLRDANGRWVGISGRARVVVYNVDKLSPAEIPNDMMEFTKPEWRGRIGWAPTNSSFQTMVTAMRQMWGEERTRHWLEGILANQPVEYEKNTTLVAGVAAGEVEVGFSNHYYLFRFLQEEGEGFKARNYFQNDAGPGSILMVAGAGVLETSQNKEAAVKFIDFMLSPVAQQYFATQTNEFPLVEGVLTARDLPNLDELNTPQIALSELADLKGTVDLLRQTGALP